MKEPKCTCRIYGKDCEKQGAITVKVRGDKSYCPRCGKWFDFEKGNYKVGE